MLASDPDAIMLVTPADHVISPNEKFQQAVAQAVNLIQAEPSRFVLFGVEPTYPSTGFGYIQRGERMETTSCPTYRVKSFHEKPNKLTAARFMSTSE